MKKKWIGVLDCNNFFVSCERLFRPDLVGKPVVVLSSNDGCVVARSQEIKDIGIVMGVPYFQIKDTLKNVGATTFSSHFALYRDISRRVFEVMREELDLVEQYSIDEAFFQIEEQPEAVARRVKEAVERQVGIPVSVGIARTKTQAKYASKMAKTSGGVCVLDESSWQALEPSISLSQIWGVGGKMELQYKRHNLITVADLVSADAGRIAQIFGVGGARLQQELSGVSVLKLGVKAAPQKSIISSRSFRDTTDNFEVLADAVAYHLRHAVADLRAMGMKTSVLRVSIGASRHGDFLLRGGTKEAVLTAPSNDSIELLQVANDLLFELYEEGVPYKKAGVGLAGLVSAAGNQATLFPSKLSDDAGALMSMVDILNNQTGREVILLGSRLRSKEWQSREDVRSPAYTTRWSEVVLVKSK